MSSKQLQPKASASPFPVENFLPTPPHPEGISTQFAANGSTKTLADIEQLALTDPDQAVKWLDLQSKLEAARILQDRRDADANFRLQMLLSTEQKMRNTAAWQASCEHRGHVREDGSMAIGGQRDSSNVFIGGCCKCHKTWRGIGSGPNQLPPHFANRLNSELIGG